MESDAAVAGAHSAGTGQRSLQNILGGRVLTLVEAYLRAKPTLDALRVWWPTPSVNSAPEHGEWFTGTWTTIDF